MASRPLPSPALWRSGLVGWLGRYPVLEQRRSQFAEWFGNRTPSERALLMALASMLALVLIVFAIYRPLRDARAQAVEDIQTYETLASNLRAAGPDIARLKSMQRGDPPTVLRSTANNYGLVPTQVNAAGAMTEAVFANVDFGRTVQWLAQIEQVSDLRVAEARFDRGTTAGLVNARILLRR